MSKTNAQNTQRRRRRSRGVPTALVILLLILALAMGGLGGFTVARMKSTDREQLAAADARIRELENTLTLIGFNVDQDDPKQWIFNDSEASNGVDDLSGAGTQTDLNPDVWSEPNILSGILNESTTSVVVAEFDGGALYSDEVIPEFNDQLTAQAFAGFSTADTSDLLMDVLTYKVSEKVIATRAKELGFDELSEADLEQVRKDAEQAYDDQLAYYSAFVAQPGMSEEEIRAAAEDYLNKQGITVDSLAEDQKTTFWTQRFYDYTVKDVTVTDDEIQSHYDAVLSDQKETFGMYPEAFEYAHLNGDIIVYNPSGFRAVRDILLPFANDEEMGQAVTLLSQVYALDPATDAEAIATAQKQLDELFAPLEETAKDVLARLQNGESFTKLMDEFSADDQLANEPMRTQGYYISSETDLFSAEFIEGSMILESPGQVSLPLRSPMGLHIVEFVKEIPAGEVPLSEVYDAIKSEALGLKQAQYYEEQLSMILESANVKFYPERLQ